MANAGDLVKGNVPTGILIGIGAVVLAPVVAPVIVAAAKPMIKTLIKTGIVAYEKGRETFAEAGEAFEDLVAEAAAEISASDSGSNGADKASRSRPKAAASA